MSVGHIPPPAPFGLDRARVVTTDLDFDKCMDVMRSEDGAYSIWFNLGDGSFSERTLTAGASYGLQTIGFDEPGVQLADLNGDRLNDVVKVTAA